MVVLLKDVMRMSRPRRLEGHEGRGKVATMRRRLPCALHLAESPGDMDFLTLHAAQRDAAAALGFRTPV
jgi:hypothetical protein